MKTIMRDALLFITVLITCTILSCEQKMDKSSSMERSTKPMSNTLENPIQKEVQVENVAPSEIIPSEEKSMSLTDKIPHTWVCKGSYDGLMTLKFFSDGTAEMHGEFDAINPIHWTYDEGDSSLTLRFWSPGNSLTEYDTTSGPGGVTVVRPNPDYVAGDSVYIDLNFRYGYEMILWGEYWFYPKSKRAAIRTAQMAR